MLRLYKGKERKSLSFWWRDTGTNYYVNLLSENAPGGVTFDVDPERKRLSLQRTYHESGNSR